MIYLKNTIEAQTLMIPRNGNSVSGDMVLVIKNTIDLNEVSIPVTDLGISALYYNLAVALPDGLATGEYQYTLTDGGVPVSCGLLCMGTLQGAREYDTTITYQQYESE